MLLPTAIKKIIFQLSLFIAITAPPDLYAQHFVIDTTGFFNDNNGEVSHPKPYASTGPKADIESVITVKEYKELVGNNDEVSSFALTKNNKEENLTPVVVLENPMPCSVYGSAWDTLNVRVKKSDLLPDNDTSFINLDNIEGSSFVFPYKGKILSPFGYRGRHFHAGVDIKLNHGDEVVCAFDGKVRMAKYYSGYGNAVVVRHSNGLETLYAHLSKIKVSVNQELKAGDLVGLGGRTGRASCDHLHFETRYLGEAFNPRQFIDLENYCLTKDVLHITSRTFGRTKDYLPTALNTGSTDDNVASAVSGTTSSHSKHGKTKGRKYHNIKNGETLYSIANRNNTTVKDLCSLNGIRKNKTLKIGTRLRVK